MTIRRGNGLLEGGLGGDREHPALPAAWWPVGFSETVRSHPTATRAGGLRICLFRDRRGAVHALEDRCAHRRVPLSLGEVTHEGLIQCSYHGWRYEGETGRCLNIPNYRPDEKVPERFGVIAYPTVERNGFIFVFAGERASEPPAPPRLDTGGSPADVRGSAVLKTGHWDFVRAVLADPIGTLGLAGVRAAGSKGQPRTLDGSVVVEGPVTRTGGPLPVGAARSAVLRMQTWGVSGLTHVVLEGPSPAPAVSVIVASTPLGNSTTAVRWRFGSAASNSARRAVLSALSSLGLGPVRALGRARSQRVPPDRGNGAFAAWRGLMPTGASAASPEPHD